MAKNKLEPHASKYVGPSTDLSVYKDVVLPPEIEEYKRQLEDKYLTPYGLNIPPYAMKWIYRAALAEGPKREEMLTKAKQRFEQHSLAAWARGECVGREHNTTPMPEDIKAELKELNKKRREEAKSHKLVTDTQLQKAGMSNAKQKRSKIPVFQDQEAQKAVLQKYPWIIPGSFKQDPEKPGGSILDIKCMCGKIRTIHLADAFQTKTCIECRKRK